MNEELVVRPSTAVDPMTGAVVAHDDPTDILAEARAAVVEQKRSLDQFAACIDEWLNERLDKANTRSAEVGGWKIETKAPTTVSFEPERLAVALHDLIAEELLEESVLERALISQPDKVNRREVDKLLRHADKRVREHIAAAGEEADQRRTVSVKRA